MKLSLQNMQRDIEELKRASGANLRQCPEGWSQYELFCYKFFNGRVEYIKARTLCANMGAHVVDIKDVAEMKYVMGLVGSSNFWIGLTDSERERTWKWDRTGTETQFVNWRRGQPDDRGSSSQDCVIAGWRFPKDQWNDQGCHHSHAFVCKKYR